MQRQIDFILKNKIDLGERKEKELVIWKRLK